MTCVKCFGWESQLLQETDINLVLAPSCFGKERAECQMACCPRVGLRWDLSH